MFTRRRHPLVYATRISYLRAKRHLRSLGSAFANRHEMKPLAERVIRHESIFLRRLGDVDMRLQENKVTNLKLAARKINGIIIQPGQTFSFWKAVGKTTARHGYVNALLISNGLPIEGIGGGICQMANMLYWMALHSPLTIIERHRHSFDLFPDSGRVLPFGTGATVFYNYVDLAFKNETTQPIQIFMATTNTHLVGELRTTVPYPFAYHIEEHDHHIYQNPDGVYFRSNKIFRTMIKKDTGQTVSREKISENFCEMKYIPDQAFLIERLEVTKS